MCTRLLAILVAALVCTAPVWGDAAEAEAPAAHAGGAAAHDDHEPLPIEDKYPYGDGEGRGHYKAVRGMLNPNGTLFLQIFIFVSFLLVMTRLVFRPTIALMDERDEELQRNHREAIEFKNKAVELKKDYDRRLAEARLKGARLISDREQAAKAESLEKLHARQEELKSKLAARRAALVSQMDEQADDVDRLAPELGQNVAAKLLGRDL